MKIETIVMNNGERTIRVNKSDIELWQAKGYQADGYKSAKKDDKNDSKAEKKPKAKQTKSKTKKRSKKRDRLSNE